MSHHCAERFPWITRCTIHQAKIFFNQFGIQLRNYIRSQRKTWRSWRRGDKFSSSKIIANSWHLIWQSYATVAFGRSSQKKNGIIKATVGPAYVPSTMALWVSTTHDGWVLVAYGDGGAIPDLSQGSGTLDVLGRRGAWVHNDIIDIVKRRCTNYSAFLSSHLFSSVSKLGSRGTSSHLQLVIWLHMTLLSRSALGIHRTGPYLQQFLTHQQVCNKWVHLSN